jgi:hypothetical protein
LIQPLERDVQLPQDRITLQTFGGRVVHGNLERSAPAVVNIHAGFFKEFTDIGVVHVKAADRKIEKGPGAWRFDEWRKNSRRGLCRTGADGPSFEDAHGGAAAPQLTRNGASNDAGTDDDDIGGFAHESIISRDPKGGWHLTRKGASHLWVRGEMAEALIRKGAAKCLGHRVIGKTELCTTSSIAATNE